MDSVNQIVIGDKTGQLKIRLNDRWVELVPKKEEEFMTNADRIRAMSDKELAEVVAGLICISHCVVSCSCSECFLEKICGEDIGVVEVLDFLKQPVKDGKGK